MKRTALVFPGQGSQYVGMAKTLCEQYPECAEIVAQADDILGYSLSEIMFNGDETLLRQPATPNPLFSSTATCSFASSTAMRWR
jgi:[Acyl-carrier-protein] S-malonyltransferase (EC 2.3.1.39)